MNETHDLAERNNRLWMVGVRYHDTSWQVVRHYYVVTAADPGQALYAGRQRSGSTAERRARKGAPLDSAWCEVHEIVTDFSGERHLKRSSSLCAGTRPASRLR